MNFNPEGERRGMPELSVVDGRQVVKHNKASLRLSYASYIVHRSVCMMGMSWPTLPVVYNHR